MILIPLGVAKRDFFVAFHTISYFKLSICIDIGLNMSYNIMNAFKTL